MAKLRSFLIIALVLILTACGEKTVTVELPASLLEGMDVESFAGQYREAKGFKKVTVNEDGSLTLVVTEEKYAAQMESMDENAKVLYLAVGQESGVFQTVKRLDYNEDYTSLTLTVDKEAYEASDEDERVDEIIYISRLYQAFALNTDGVIEINFIDENTGEIYKTDLYSAAGKIDETGEEAS